MPTVTRTLVSGIMALGLAACASPSAEPPPPVPTPPATQVPPPADDKCNSRVVADVVGQPYNDALLARIKTAVGHDKIRPIRPGEAVTMDFVEERLNLEIGADGKVVRVFCS
jgi:hypothetical protein